MLPNGIDGRVPQSPLMFTSTDFSRWETVWFPPTLQRDQGNCFVEQRMGAVVLLNGASSTSSLNTSCTTDSGLQFVYKDLLLYDLVNGGGVWEDYDLYEDDMAPRYGALMAFKLNHSSYHVDVSYMMGGTTTPLRSTITSGVTTEGQYLFDFWFSIDRRRWIRTLLSLPWLVITPDNIGQLGSGLEGAQLTSSPSGCLVLLTSVAVEKLGLVASVDGGFTWRVCTDDVGFSPRSDPTLGWWQAGGHERLMVMGGHSSDTLNVTAEVWLSSIDFSNVTQVTTACRLPRPAHDQMGVSEAVIKKIYNGVTNKPTSTTQPRAYHQPTQQRHSETDTQPRTTRRD